MKHLFKTKETTMEPPPPPPPPEPPSLTPEMRSDMDLMSRKTQDIEQRLRVVEARTEALKRIVARIAPDLLKEEGS